MPGINVGRVIVGRTTLEREPVGRVLTSRVRARRAFVEEIAR